MRAELIEVVLHGLARRFPHVHLHVAVDLRRSYPREALVAATAGLIETFPVLGCRYAPGWWRDRWVPWTGDVEELVRTERVDDVGRATRVEARREFDHLRQPPFRVALFDHGGGSRLLASVHHMVADGGGAKALIHVLASRLVGIDPKPPPGRNRGLGQLARALRLRDVPVLAVELLREALRPLSILRVRRLARAFERTSDDTGPSWATVELEAEDADRFAAFCRSHGATINDGLVAAVARLAARRADTGPVAAGYTIDLRRYLPSPVSVVTNLHAVALAVLRRDRLATADRALRAVSDCIGGQKRRLPGLASTMLFALGAGWLPAGLVRWTGRRAVSRLRSLLDRALAVTNIGALDEAVAPFGRDAVRASIFGPFVRGLGVPVVVATGFRGGFTLHVCGEGGLSAGALEGFGAELREALTRCGPSAP